jgi:SAM-dependent methyltransferase
VVTEFVDVTELAGNAISAEQLERVSHRYYWTIGYCRNKDVVEIGCGCGQGLGVLSSVAKSLEAGDYSGRILSLAQTHYRGRVRLRVFEKESLPFEDASKDVIILFEALYYIQDAAQFASECRRILRPGGRLLIATANKDLIDFSSSRRGHRYYGVLELTSLFRGAGFEVEIFGHVPVRSVMWQRMTLWPVKKLAEVCHVHPRTTANGWLLKRLSRGDLLVMPAELPAPAQPLVPPSKLSTNRPDPTHRVLYCCATLRPKNTLQG